MDALYRTDKTGHTVGLVPENIRPELKTYAHWVVHLDKEPYDPKTGKRASTTDSRTWAPFSEALEAFEESGRWDGIGFVFCSADPFVGIDFDKCRNPETGVVDPRILAYVEKFEERYVEVSVSGTGLHLITKGKIKGGAKKGGYEVYDQDRFFTVTGVPLDA
jgi:putative DNA primase/helicase